MNYLTVSPGDPMPECSVGDFLLVNRGRYVGRIIRWGQAIRFRGPRRVYAQWNHAALVVSEQGDLVEALVGSGATRSHLSKYENVCFVVVRTECVPLDQQQVLTFADRIVGEDYGFLQDFVVFLGYLTCNRLAIGVQGSVNCSGLVARAQERAGAYFSRLAETLAPADLAEAYQVKGTE